jgi:hypothetical protein
MLIAQRSNTTPSAGRPEYGPATVVASTARTVPRTRIAASLGASDPIVTAAIRESLVRCDAFRTWWIAATTAAIAVSTMKLIPAPDMRLT